VQVFDELERAVGVLARFHVDAHEILERIGAADELLDVGEALVVREIEAELRQLEGDVPANLRIVNRRQRAEVDVARFGGFFEARDAFAEVVEGDGDSFVIEAPADDDGLVEGIACHEPGGQPLGSG
jgi:hypothetical protein